MPIGGPGSTAYLQRSHFLLERRATKKRHLLRLRFDSVYVNLDAAYSAAPDTARTCPRPLARKILKSVNVACTSDVGEVFIVARSREKGELNAVTVLFGTVA